MKKGINRWIKNEGKVFVLFLLIGFFSFLNVQTVSADEKIENLKESLEKYNTDKVLFTESEEKLIEYAFEQFSKGKGIIVAYSGAFNEKDFPYLKDEDLEVLLTKVIEDNCNGTDIGGITLWGNIDSYNKGLVKFNSYTLICMSLNYRTPMEKMESLDAFYRETYARLEKTYSISKKDAFHKVKIIHDFICETFDYDENLTTNYDDYSGLMKNKEGKNLMVCQGYSLMCAKLLNMSGVECRIVLSKDKSHSWNIVRIGDVWYHLDVTHDDTGYFNNTYDYRYFLRSNLSKEATYNMAKSCYLYSSLDGIVFADKDYDPALWNKLNMNRHVYDFFFRTLYTNQNLTSAIFLVICIILCIGVLSFVKKYFIKKTNKKNRDYHLYNEI